MPDRPYDPASDPALPELELLYEDNHLLGINKPAGLLSQGDASGEECLLDRVREWIRITCRKPGNVYCALLHRLDRPVSGAMLFARTEKAARRLSEQFRTRAVEKQYRAVVRRAPPRERDTLRHWLVRDEAKGLTRVLDQPAPEASEARLRYEILRRAPNGIELGIELETGRKHQIRAQLARIGCPIAGDRRYGAKESIENGRAIALHAASLSFLHPTRRIRIEIEAPFPAFWPLLTNG